MNDLQSENVLKGVEVAIAVEQRMRVLETERRDEAIDGLPDGPPPSAQAAIVSSGRLRESDAAVEAYDGHHIQVYVANFSGPHGRLAERGLLTEESNQHQYRFQHIADPATGRALFEIEHEVRSLRHPMYARPLVNRNPRQTNRAYVPGRDAWVPEPTGPEMDDPRVEMRRRRFEDAKRRAAG